MSTYIIVFIKQLLLLYMCVCTGGFHYILFNLKISNNQALAYGISSVCILVNLLLKTIKENSLFIDYTRISCVNIHN